jgi:hypothetical protein
LLQNNTVVNAWDKHRIIIDGLCRVYPRLRLHDPMHPLFRAVDSVDVDADVDVDVFREDVWEGVKNVP